jgi:hypothetical protein
MTYIGLFLMGVILPVVIRFTPKSLISERQILPPVQPVVKPVIKPALCAIKFCNRVLND